MDSSDTREIQSLIQDLETGSITIRLEAVKELGNIGDRSTIQPLFNALSKETDAQLRQEMEKAIELIWHRIGIGMDEKGGNILHLMPKLEPLTHISLPETISPLLNLAPVQTLHVQDPDAQASRNTIPGQDQEFSDLVNTLEEESSRPLEEEAVGVLHKLYVSEDKKFFKTKSGRAAFLAEVEKMKQAGGFENYQREYKATVDSRFGWLMLGLIALGLIIAQQTGFLQYIIDMFAAIPIPFSAKIGAVAGLGVSTAYTILIARAMNEASKDPSFEHDVLSGLVQIWLICFVVLFLVSAIPAFLKGLGIGASMGMGLRVGLMVASAIALLGTTPLFWRPNRRYERHSPQFIVLERGARVMWSGAIIMVGVNTILGGVAGWLGIQTIISLWSTWKP